jgi:magnesium chelatase family protein
MFCRMAFSLAPKTTIRDRTFVMFHHCNRVMPITPGMANGDYDVGKDLLSCAVLLVCPLVSPVPRPGEVSRAHNGVLFLDEFPEFPRHALDVMRQPLEDGMVCIARAAMALTFPARFMPAAAMNPCPSGFHNDRTRECHCTPPMIQRYISKISGPLLDPIDIHIDVPAVNYKELRSSKEAETSARILERVIRARDVQLERFSSERQKVHCNTQMPTQLIRKFCE